MLNISNMSGRVLIKNISIETMSAVFIIIFAALFILANLTIGFVWSLYILAMSLGFIIAARHPRSGLFAVVFLTVIFERFFTLQSFFIGKVEYKLYPLDILMLGTIVGIFWQYVFGIIKKLHMRKTDYILISFIILNAVYFIFSRFIIHSDSVVAFSTLKNYGFYSLFFFITLFLIRNENDLKRLFKFFLAGAIGIVAFIIIGILRGQGLWSEFTPLSTSGVRALAFTHGLYLTLALVPFMLYQLFKKENAGIGAYWLLAIWGIGIVGTLMRHLWIAAAIAMAFVYIFISAEKRKSVGNIAVKLALPVLIAVIFAFYIAILVPQSSLTASAIKITGAVSERAGSLAQISRDESYFWRSLVWNSAYEQFKRNPLFGIGTGQRVYAEVPDYKDFIEVRNIHNSYLAILIQFGILGLVVFLYFVHKNIGALMKSGGGEKYNFYKLSVLSIAAIYAIAFFFQPYLETNLLSVFFWINMGFVRVLPEIKLGQAILKPGFRKDF